MRKTADSPEERLERLRVLSQGKPPEYYEKLNDIQRKSRRIAEIFGVYSGNGSRKMKTEEKLNLDNMSFKEKRRLFEAEYPMKSSSKELEKARKRLSFIASNMQNLPVEKSTPVPSTKPVSGNIHTFQSWTSTATESEADLTAERVENTLSMSISTKKSSMKTSIYENKRLTVDISSSWDVLSGPITTEILKQLDSFANSPYDAAFYNSTQSPSLASNLDRTSLNMDEISDHPSPANALSE